jgi:acyl-CoA hydrolase
VRLHPLAYTAAYRFLMRERVDVGVLNLAPGPGPFLSASVSADVAPAIFFYAGFRVALVNAAAPRIDDAARTPLFNRDAFDLIVECDEPYLAAAPEPASTQTEALARQVAPLVEDGDAVQFGIGKLAAALLPILRDRRRLRIHSGFYVDAVLDLADSGALDAETPMRAGVALVSQGALRRLAEDERAHFAPVPRTHGLADIAMVERFVSINSALEVDLFGQTNCEFLEGRQISGIGGGLDFIRGAHASRGGRAIIALPSESKGVSRIMPRLAEGAATIPRACADIVVTEHGVARVRHLDLDARAEALIAIAAPAHRAGLAEAWRELRARM